MKLEVGMYVKTKVGKIVKIIKLFMEEYDICLLANVGDNKR